jgi:AI-2 transport protein TqsA
MLALCTAILVAAALCFARPVFAPVAFSVLAIALMWPLQRLLEASIPKLIASTIVLLTSLLLIGALAAAVAWVSA